MHFSTNIAYSLAPVILNLQVTFFVQKSRKRPHRPPRPRPRTPLETALIMKQEESTGERLYLRRKYIDHAW
jgi:hypothetical protein